MTRAADGGWLLEGGLSAAGSFLGWLGRLLSSTPDELARLAGESPPGARGVVAVPWLDGAGPVVRDDARAGFVGLGAAHGASDLARAVMEAVAWDVMRVMEVVTVGRLGGSTAAGVTLGGAGSGLPVWVEVLTSVPGVPTTRHRSGERPRPAPRCWRAVPSDWGSRSTPSTPWRPSSSPTPPRSRCTAASGRGPTTSPRRYWLRPSRCPVRAAVRPTEPVRVALAYGREGTWVEVPDTAEVVAPVDLPTLGDEAAAIADASAPAGRAAVDRSPRARRSGGGLFADLTRPMPNRTVLPPLLAELARPGVPDGRITLLCATGTHRQATAAEMQELVGPGIVARYSIIDHDARAMPTNGSVRSTGRRCSCSASTWRPMRIITGSSNPTSSPASAAAPRRCARG